MRDGKEIAVSKPVSVSRTNWQPISVRLLKPSQRGRLTENYTMADITANEGGYQFSNFEIHLNSYNQEYV